MTPLTPRAAVPPFEPTLWPSVAWTEMSVVGRPSRRRWIRPKGSTVRCWAKPTKCRQRERVGAETKFLFDRRDPQNVIKIQAGDWLGSGTGYYLCARAPAEGMEMDVDNASIH